MDGIIPVFGGGGDATLTGIGAGCTSVGQTHIYIGTSGWVILFIELPSGRRLAYVRPKVEKDDNGKTIITYEGVGDNKKWLRLKTYGAKLVENITQGIARDLLLHSMAAMKDMDIVGDTFTMKSS